MRFYQMKLSTTVIAIGLFALAQAQFHPSQFRSGASGFVPSVQQQQESEEDDRIADSTPAAAVNYRQQSYEYEEDDEEARQPTQPPQIRRQQYLRPNNYAPQPAKQASNTKNQFEDELEVEEPDRLALFLEKSTFQCEGRTGYYADESVDCEVFHYCQENQKHSWVCPEGFLFHQVHLICMPPSGDNICQQSSKYHIVNDFLYKAINVEEHETKPNVSLRYSERYYPDNIYHDERQEENQDDYASRDYRQRQPIQIGLRKSVQHTTVAPAYHRQQQITQQQPSQVSAYRSPDDINISLQQRRPQIVFNPTTTRYEDDEYNYEK